ncbi:MAG: Gx transporter family protein [Candidatus Ornithospirochaeta sp.]|nr:Gx transporter family protein [Sphaerochaetaceae bacterium]MDD7162396.1 Gx transporter family protein [Sphaerochaetaceae bacterium]MDY5523894.1 Gx transporter family protein [Candidatus Ornithospirochaeta sp.]
METRKIARMGLLTALALILSYVESLIPAFVAVPGVKMGLANIVVVFALYTLGPGEAAIVSIIRVLLSSLLFGSILSLSYSAAGAVISLLSMIILMKTKIFGVTSVSVTGGVFHNLGQILVACLVLETDVLLYYLPVLILSGTITGAVIGIASSIVIKRLQKSI